MFRRALQLTCIGHRNRTMYFYDTILGIEARPRVEMQKCFGQSRIVFSSILPAVPWHLQTHLSESIRPVVGQTAG